MIKKICVDCSDLNDELSIFCRKCGGSLREHVETENTVVEVIDFDGVFKDNLFSSLLIFFSVVIGFFISMMFELLLYSSVDVSNSIGNFFLKAGIFGIMGGIVLSAFGIYWVQPRIKRIYGKEIARLDIAYYSISTCVLGILLFY